MSSISSLPLMGIGNAIFMGRAGSRCLLITPHGDRKRLAGRPDPGCLKRLITPHGDRKHGLAQLCPGERFGLITPHGDRKHGPGAVDLAVGDFSLPLMGIGNRYCGGYQGSYGWLITPHGDRKLVSPTPVEVTVNTSLPLMGIGNRLDPGLRVGDVQLITPHGDRKPDDRNVAHCGCDGSSLPLMGIGNLPWPARITSTPCPHYPSWGSETFSSCSLIWPRSLLITPHGDRKREAPPGAREAPRTHYPSWGSETCGTACCVGGIAVSLPLMGIGNAVEHVCAAIVRHLITPHGDRKR